MGENLTFLPLEGDGMTSQERTEIATLGVTLAAFIERYERDQDDAKEYRASMISTTQKLDERIGKFEHLQSKAGGVVLAVGFVLTALAGFFALAWKWIIQQLAGAAS